MRRSTHSGPSRGFGAGVDRRPLLYHSFVCWNTVLDMETKMNSTMNKVLVLLTAYTSLRKNYFYRKSAYTQYRNPSPLSVFLLFGDFPGVNGSIMKSIVLWVLGRSCNLCESSKVSIIWRIIREVFFIWKQPLPDVWMRETLQSVVFMTLFGSYCDVWRQK